jgi:hypothetical protein
MITNPADETRDAEPPPVLAIWRIGGGVTGFSQVGVWVTRYRTLGPTS